MKNYVKKIVLAVATLALLLVASSTAAYAVEEEDKNLIAHVNNELVEPATVTQVHKGETYTIKVYQADNSTLQEDITYAQPLDADGKAVKSTIAADGVLKPSILDAGKTIFVKCSTTTLDPVKEVTVQFYIVAAEKIKLSKTSHTMNITNQIDLTATVTPSTAWNKEIVWKTSNAKVATVNKGTVTAIAAGTCEITASLKDGSLPVTCKITVRKPVLNQSSKSIAKGKKFTLKVLNLNKSVTWKSSNSKIATVKKGVVTAKKKGSVMITAKCGGYTMQCKVTVTTPILVNSKKDEVSGINVTRGFSRILNIQGSKSPVTWRSSNEKIATVHNGVVKGIKTGSCFVYATVDGKTIQCKVTTKVNKFTTKAITNGRRLRKGKVSLSNSAIYYDGGKLIYKCYAVNTTNYYKIERYNNITISIYANKKLVAKQSYKNIKLNLKKYKSKALTFTFAPSNVKKVVDLRNTKITVQYSYNYQYLD